MKQFIKLFFLTLCIQSANFFGSDALKAQNLATNKIMFDLVTDISNGSDKKIMTVFDGDEIPLQKLLIYEGKGIYAGGSQNNNNLPYKVSFMLDNKSLSGAHVQGIPLQGQTYRESENIGLTDRQIKCKVQDGVTFDMKTDVRDKSDKDFKTDVKNGTLIPIKDLLVNNRGIYIGRLRINFTIRFMQGAKCIGTAEVGSVPQPGQTWRACSNVAFNGVENKDIQVKMDESLTIDLAYDVENAGDVTFKQGLKNNDIIKYGDLFKKKIRTGILNRTIKGIYAGNAKKNFTIEFVSEPEGTLFAKVEASSVPQNGQTWRESGNIDFAAKVKVKITPLSLAEIVGVHAPCIVLSSDERYFPSSVSDLNNSVRLYEQIDNNNPPQIKVSIRNANGKNISGEKITIKEDVKGKTFDLKRPWESITYSNADIDITAIQDGDVISDKEVLKKMWDYEKPKYFGGYSGKEDAYIFLYKGDKLLCKVRCSNKPLNGQNWRESNNFCLGEQILSDVNKQLGNKESDRYKGWYPTDDFNAAGNLKSAKTYVVVNRNNANELKFTYHFFYPYNGVNRSGAGYLRHFGDWERFCVSINKLNKNSAKYIYYHHADSTIISPSDVKNHSGHPVVYVAAQTHAAYADNNGIVERLGGGKLWQTQNSIELVTDGAGVTKPGYEWIDWKGKWGHPGFHRTEK